MLEDAFVDIGLGRGRRILGSTRLPTDIGQPRSCPPIRSKSAESLILAWISRYRQTISSMARLSSEIVRYRPEYAGSRWRQSPEERRMPVVDGQRACASQTIPCRRFRSPESSEDTCPSPWLVQSAIEDPAAFLIRFLFLQSRLNCTSSQTNSSTNAQQINMTPSSKGCSSIGLPRPFFSSLRIIHQAVHFVGAIAP